MISSTIEFTEMMVLWCLIEQVVFKFGFEKRDIFSIFYIKRCMEISGKGLLHFHQESVTKLITGQTCFCLINPTLAMSRTMSAFVLWSMAKYAVFL